MPAAEQRAGDNRPPAATAGRVKKTADDAERDHVLDLRRLLAHRPQRFHKHPDAEQAEIGDDESFDEGRVKAREQIGADHAADDASRRKPQEQAPIDVAMREMRSAGCGGCERFGGVDHGRGVRGGHAECEQHAGRDHAIGHAQGAIDELGQKSNGEEQEERLRQDFDLVRGQIHQVGLVASRGGPELRSCHDPQTASMKSPVNRAPSGRTDTKEALKPRPSGPFPNNLGAPPVPRSPITPAKAASADLSSAGILD